MGMDVTAGKGGRSEKINDVLQAAEHFISHDASVVRIEPYGHGIIHDTYLVKLSSGDDRFILQRINQEVFADPVLIMRNLRLVSHHVRQQQQSAGSGVDADWQMVYGLPARDGRDYFIDAAGAFWRALSYVRGAVPLERISSLAEAGEAGRALGTFHRLVSTLKPEMLYETLPGFHDVGRYLARYDAARAGNRGNSEPERYCRQTIENRRSWAPVLENARRENLLPVRVIHGDPKSNNIMIDRSTGRAVSIIDLDTVMPGLVQYDIGDCLRSSCNTLGEDADDFAGIRFDLQRCAAVLTGYTEAAGFLTGADYDYFFDAVRFLSFELGLRFYTDFLQGNLYFKVSSRKQNLNRSVVQFKLLESIEAQEVGIRKIIAGCRMLIPGSSFA
jgi:Ser/Thr protein kinase RdoA (MazF antagonist)